MKLTVLLFGPYADVVGDSSVELEIPSPVCTSCDVKTMLGEKYPVLQTLLKGAVIAVNQQIAGPDDTVRSTDELAVIGMVSGG